MNPTAKLLSALALAAAVACGPLSVSAAPAEQEAEPRKQTDLRAETPSADVQHIAAWAIHSGDHKGLPFIIIDKVNARAVAFDRTGKLLQTTPVLIGMGVGDKFAPGVVDLDMHHTLPAQRITPAGRFFADEGRNLEGQTVLWIDYDAGIALHKIPEKKTKQRRHERMVSPDPAQHRITYGCVNVPPAFYDRVVRAHFKARGGIVYVLPDSAPVQAVFKSYAVDPRPLFNVRQTRATTGSAPFERF